MTDDNIEKLKAMLRKHEAVRGFPYDDKTGKQIFKGNTIQGNITIGVGRNLFANPLSNKVIDICLDEDIAEATDALINNVPCFSSLSAPRQAALIDMAFNTGWFGLSKFRNMLSALNKGDYEAAADEMRNSIWHTQVGQRAIDLENMMRSGKWL